jgi:hypothetical protein
MEHLVQVHVVRVAPCPVSLLRFRHVNLLGQPTVSGDACHPYELRHVNPVGEIHRFSPWVAEISQQSDRFFNRRSRLQDLWAESRGQLAVAQAPGSFRSSVAISTAVTTASKPLLVSSSPARANT